MILAEKILLEKPHSNIIVKQQGCVEHYMKPDVLDAMKEAGWLMWKFMDINWHHNDSQEFHEDSSRESFEDEWNKNINNEQQN